MSKEIESLKRIETTFSMNKQGKESVYREYTNSVYPYYEDFDLVLKALQRLDTLEKGKNADIIDNYMGFKNDNSNPSEALKCLEELRSNLGVIYDDTLNTIEQALLKEQEPKQYLKWEDLVFSYGTKTQKVRMVDTIYKIVYANYDNTKEVQLLSEDEKLLYISFVGKYKDNVQLFNDLHLERVEENE